MPLSVIILAAGQGTRMKSARPKVIHEVAGKAMLQHVVDVSHELNAQQILVVIGHGAEQVEQAMQGQGIQFVSQQQQLGTGHAVLQCLDVLETGNDVLVLYGDVPLIQASTLNTLVEQGAGENRVSLLSFQADDPTGYGRIVRDRAGHVQAIVEEKDANDEVRRITESNSGILFIKGGEVEPLLKSLDNDNAQKEYYLTDVVKHAVANGHSVGAVICEDENEVLGVNNQQQLANIEAILRQRRADHLMLQGAKLVDPQRIDIRGNLKVGKDVVIDVNCIFEGDVELGDGVRVGANCVITDSTIGADTTILPMCIVERSHIGEANDLGPYARIRPDTTTQSKAKIGNFVEIKKSFIAEGSKVNHLTYIGDAEIGSNVNVGAGTITCNYDGAFKHKTTIEDDVFVGSGTQLVAPVRLARGTTVGAGSTVTKDTAANDLVVTRAKQVAIKGWQRPKKDK